jgi:DNA-binding Lrp family transcriptional regulator
MKSKAKIIENAVLIQKTQQLPEATQADLARIFATSTPTIQRALRRLREAGDLKEHLMVTRTNRYFPSHAAITIQVNLRDLEDPEFGYADLDSFAALLETRLYTYPQFDGVMDKIVIERVEITLGDSDILIFLFATDASALGAFVTKVLRRFRGLVRSHTAMLIPIKKIKGTIDERHKADSSVRKSSSKSIVVDDS